MEKIRERSMTAFVASSLLNAGIGLGTGLIVGIILAIASKSGIVILASMLVGAIAFAFITLNMYRLYFFYRLSMDVNAVCEGDGQESGSFLVAAVLSVLTFGIYELVWLYHLAQRLKVNAPRYGFKMVEGGKDIVVLNAMSFGYIGTWELIKNMNRIANIYNRAGLAPDAEELLQGGAN
ncbi:MAG: DUF4234 domain-containing protein [Faecousia sp.]